MNKTRAQRKAADQIPPPPGLEEGYDAIIEYHTKYSMEELEKAGYLEEVSEEEWREVQAAATYQLLCMQGLRLKLARGDCLRLAALAARQDLPVDKLVKLWIKQHLRGTAAPRKGERNAQRTA